NFLKSKLQRLAREQRALSRKVKDSKRYKKQKLVVSNLHWHVANCRADFLHKLSTNIVRRYDTICIEDLKVSEMIRDRKFSRSISDLGWSSFTRMLAYKSEWYGKNLVRV